ncbi:MAG: serine O-acetyltransferase [Lachnospiraceae bacterium]|nr:serine O-acetyltransferase [Lachnospiraceae bacterium]
MSAAGIVKKDVNLIKKYIEDEIKVVRERDPAIHNKWEVFLYSSFWAVLMYRIAHRFYLKKHYFTARLISQIARDRTGIEIHPGAEIGKGFFIDHGSGVVVGETTVIGNNVTLYQGVTLGGTGKEKGKRHPTLKDNVMVSVGAKVLGSFTIGENSKIGAGSVVLNEIPPNCTVVGVPGKIVKRGDVEIPRKTMDQVHLPDPIQDDINTLKHADTEITNQLLSLKDTVRELKREIEKGKTGSNEDI